MKGVAGPRIVSCRAGCARPLTIVRTIVPCVRSGRPDQRSGKLVTDETLCGLRVDSRIVTLVPGRHVLSARHKPALLAFAELFLRSDECRALQPRGHPRVGAA